MGVAEKQGDRSSLEVRQIPGYAGVVGEREAFAELDARNIGRGEGSGGSGGSGFVSGRRDDISARDEKDDRRPRGECGGGLIHAPKHLKPDVVIDQQNGK